MAERSKKLYTDKSKLKQINPETVTLINRYKMDMELRELSETTIYGYINDLESWLVYVLDKQNNKSALEITEDDLTEFFYYCKSEGNNTRRIKRRMSSISAFYKYLRKKRIVVENPCEFIDRPKKDVDVNPQTFLSQEQVFLMKYLLKEKAKSGKRRDSDLRLYALFSLSTMARVHAISIIRWEQIDLSERTATDVIEKEGKKVTLYYSEEVKDLLYETKKQREQMGYDDGGYVFGRNGKNIAVDVLERWCKKIGKMIDVPTLHPHDFRHSGSQLLKLNGCPIEQISELLNHSGLDVTKKHYLRADKKKMREYKDRYEVA
jgi:site-specific recombinase XerD